MNLKGLKFLIPILPILHMNYVKVQSSQNTSWNHKVKVQPADVISRFKGYLPINIKYSFKKGNYVFAANSDFLFPKYLQPLRYFKLWILLDKIN